VIPLEDHAALQPVPVPVWALLAAALAVLAVYAVLIENGAVLARAAPVLHELFHDARHLAGVPCH
jgi:uncharacterized protein (UPF0276 family)